MKTKTYTIEVPEDLRLGQFLYNVLRDNGFEHHVGIQTFIDGKHESAKYTGVDCYYIGDMEFAMLRDQWIKEDK